MAILPRKRGGARPGAGRKPKAKLTADELLRVLNNPQDIEALIRVRLRRYKLSKREFDELVAEQKGMCGLCGRPLTSASWALDHDHFTGKVRAVLHGKCNSLLGFADEDPERLAQAIAYLRKHNRFLR